MAPPQESLGTTIAMGFLKTVVCIYDVVTFPIYFLMQQPWEEWKKANNVYVSFKDLESLEQILRFLFSF